MRQVRYHYVTLSLLTTAAIVVGWSAVTYSGLIKDFFLPTPSAVISAFTAMLVNEGLVQDILISLYRITVGFGIATALAVPIGIAVGANKSAEALIEPLIDFIRYIPIPATLPLFILWFGIGELEKILVIAASVFFQLSLMVANAIQSTPKEMIESGLGLGSSKWQIVTKIMYPYAKPRILDDMRISLGWAWSALMISEIIGSTSGIGHLIIQAQRLLQSDHVFSVVIIIGLLGLTSDFAIKLLHKALFPWVQRRA